MEACIQKDIRISGAFHSEPSLQNIQGIGQNVWDQKYWTLLISAPAFSFIFK